MELCTLIVVLVMTGVTTCLGVRVSRYVLGYLARNSETIRNAFDEEKCDQKALIDGALPPVCDQVPFLCQANTRAQQLGSAEIALLPYTVQRGKALVIRSQAGMPYVEDEDKSRVGRVVPNFVLERVVKDQCLSVAPLPRLVSHAYRCTLAHGKTYVHAKTDVRRALRKREEQLRAHVVNRYG